MPHSHAIEFRVCYYETDKMNTYNNARALEWFERGRNELLRSAGLPYSEMEARGLMLPVTEAHVEYLGRAQYDDLLRLTATFEECGRVRVRVNVEIDNVETGRPVCRGYTVHAIVNTDGRPMRPPEWFKKLVDDTLG